MTLETQQMIKTILRLIENEAKHYYVIKRQLKTSKDCQLLPIAISLLLVRGFITDNDGLYTITNSGKSFLTQPTPATPTPEKNLPLAELTNHSIKQLKIAGELVARDNTTEANKTMWALISTYTTLANALPSPGQCAYCLNIANIIKGYYPLELNHEELDDLIETLEAQD